MSQMTFSMDCSNLVNLFTRPTFIGKKDPKNQGLFYLCKPCIKYPVYICMFLFTICITINVRPYSFLYAISYAWDRRQAVCSYVYPKPRFCIKMHVTKYGYNEFGPVVPWASLYTKFTVVCIRFTAYFHTCPLWPWPLTSKFNRVHLLTMVNMSAKFDQETINGLVAIVFTSSFPYNYVHCDLDLWPLTSKINRVHPLTMVNMSAKFDKEIHNCLVFIKFTSLFPYMSIVTLTFDLWPPKSIGFILSSWLTCLPSLTKKHATV